MRGHKLKNGLRIWAECDESQKKVFNNSAGKMATRVNDVGFTKMNRAKKHGKRKPAEIIYPCRQIFHIIMHGG
jgi:hypothetical protein